MATKAKAPEKGKIDWLTIGIVGAGAAGLGVGLILWLKKDAFAAGDKIYCGYKYQHEGPGGPFLFKISLGSWVGIGEVGWFDELDGTQQEFEGDIPESAQLETVKTMVTYVIPDILGKGKYDVEASIRYPDGSIVPGMRVIAKNIVVIEG